MELTSGPPSANGLRVRGQREVHLRDLWAVVMRHWRLVALLTAIVAGGAYVSGRDAVPRFQSRLTVQISSAKQVFARSDDIDVDELALRTDPILSEALVLTTQGLALRVVEALDLQLEVDDPTVYRGDAFAGVAVDSGAPPARYTLSLDAADRGWELRDAVGQLVGTGSYGEPAAGPGFSVVARPPADGRRAVRFRIVRSEEAAAWVSAGLSYRVREATNAVDISFTSTDPTLVPLVLNQAAVELRNDGAERARQAAARKRSYIADQLVRAEQAAAAKRAELQRYKETERITDLSAEEQAIVQAISELERQKQGIRLSLATLRDATADSAAVGIETLNQLAAVEGSQRNTALAFQTQRLLELYEERRSLTAGALGLRPDNPQVQALDQRIGESHTALRAAVAAEIAALAQRERAVDERIGERRRELLAFPGKESRIAELRLESNLLDDTYRYLLGQYEQARMQEATISPYVAILDGASPPVRFGTNVQQKLLLGLLVGLLLGLGGAFFLEYLDQTIKSAGDVERVLGMPVLGLIPFERSLAASGNGAARQPIVVLSQLAPDDPAVEAYRALRTNVTFVGAERPLQLLAVTSPGPGEGKTTTAANLALALAQGGARVLLVDADLRRPQLHRAFDLPQAPGVTDVLVGKARVADAMRRDVRASLDVLPAGALPPNPAELLGSDAMRQLLGEVRRDYEYIVADTPPALPVTDATVMAATVDATILVMRSGETEEVAARRVVEQLGRVRARVAGVVLNGVSQRHDHYYTYYAHGAYAERRGRAGRKSLKARIAGMF